MISKKLKNQLKAFVIGACGAIAVLLAGIVAFYLWGLPYIASSPKAHSFIDKKLYEYAGVNMIAEDVNLKTSYPYISFSAGDFELLKGGNPILILKNTDAKISLSKVLFKKIVVKKLGADYIYADVNKILAIVSGQEEKKEPVKCDWYFDFMDSLLYLKQLKVLYMVNDVSFNIDTKGIELDNTQSGRQYVHFDFNMLVKQNKNAVRVSLQDKDKFYILKKKLYMDENIVTLNKSKLHFKGDVVDDKKFNVEVFAKGFEISNIVAIIRSNVIIPNGADLLSYFDDIKGNFDFKFKLTPKGLNGDISLRHLCFLLIPIENVPVHLHSGKVLVDTKNIYLKGFSGYYGTRPVNTMKFSGKIDDYTKSLKAHIDADGIIADDFAKYYLTPVIGVPINIVGKSDTKLFMDYVNNVVKLKWLFRVLPEDNLLVSGEPVTPYKEERVVIADMSVEGTFLKIKDLSYIVTIPGVKEFYRRKIISLHGLIDFAKGVDFRVMGFEIEKPVSSVFLNIIARQELFKEGTVVGKLTAVDGPKGVKLFGNINLDKIKVPSQRLYVHNANIATNFDTINVTADGGYRRSKYSAKANIVNNLAFPMVINNIDFSLDSMDLEKLLASFNQQGDGVAATKAPDLDDDALTFDITNLIIKNCKLRLGKATYKELAAENMEATLTLDENGDLDLDSNRFDFAKGHSSAHVCCDLKKHNYHVKLGVKDVDSNLIATTLLNLPKEISGKASGIIDIYTDDKLKLNGNIKFLVKKGTIGKIGLIEYVLNVASVFRNPIAMINPVIVFDLINVPNGEFDKIQGTLDIKDNVIDSIKIKSYAKYLSAYIVGCYDLEKQDAALRIYTKMTNKKDGLYGFLRGISLSNIASRVSIGARNDVAYYSHEVSEIPEIEAGEKDAQIFLTTVDGDVEHYNFLSSLKKLK